MLEATASRLRCPRCRRDGAIAVEVIERDTAEIRSGTLRCSNCAWTGAVAGGIADLLFEPPDFVVREIAGLERFAEEMRLTGWDRERVLRLPDEPSPFWIGQRASFEQVRAAGGFRPGERLLDVGANTCWASAGFARGGLDVTALDISRHALQGLETADWWMEHDGTHFERVLGVMFALPFASGTFDHAFCCEVLHHNTPGNLLRTFRELHRVLRPGGRLTVIRETLRAPGDLQLRPGHEVAQYEGNEHAFAAASYLTAARVAGFRVEVLDPAAHWVLSGAPLPPPARARARVKLAALDALRRRPRGRRAYRAWLHHVAGGVPLSFVARR